MVVQCGIAPSLLFILFQCVRAWQTPHIPVAIVLSGSTGVQSDSCWLGALWYYTCAASLPAPRSRLPVCAWGFFVCWFEEDKDDMIILTTTEETNVG